ncbi:hypothetical protein PBAL39_15474 [Pedobacter sp. BAL39]|uniref:MbnP family protein n=1 Tax=Pedobacter sp. BAL39 TaxID=391596 RepID=UPI0001559DBE|nr:MbnP family protein [Pedobacter sp. BAL39]EDM37838.1 hypothetical protein PBAL39_15474 [Pedobacter sp. BAL39]
MKRLFSIILVSIILITSCSKDDDKISQLETEGKATVTFDAAFGTQDFALNKDFTSGTKTFNFTKFRYWVSGVALVNSKGEEYKIPGSYFLLEETGSVAVQDGAFTYPATKRESIELKGVPVDDYKTIKFSIGVDSKYNDNLSLQTGELSQLNGMTNVSWMWMTSYIFSAIGGKVTQAGTAQNLLIETGLNSNYKSVVLDFPSVLHISSTKDSKIVLKADVEKAIDGVDVVANPVVGASKAAIMTAVATNYSTKVFTVSSVN